MRSGNYVVKWLNLCNQFVYLGLLFNYNGTCIFTVTQKTLPEQGKKATFSLLSKIHEDFF